LAGDVGKVANCALSVSASQYSWSQPLVSSDHEKSSWQVRVGATLLRGA